MDPATIFRILSNHGVRFVLVGGLAATAHGSSRTTFDIDVCFRQDPENCESLSRALAELEASITPPRPVSVELTPELLQRYRHLNLRTIAGRLDVLSEIPGLGTYDELIGDAVELEMERIEISMLSLEQLIISKRALNQPKDREHLDQLEALKRLRDSHKRS